MNLDNEHIDPMEYDILLELATRIGGRYMSWAYETQGTPAEQHWRDQAIKVRQTAWAVDSGSAAQIMETKQELVSLWKSLPARRPLLAA